MTVVEKAIESATTNQDDLQTINERYFYYILNRFPLQRDVSTFRLSVLVDAGVVDLDDLILVRY